MLGQLERLRAVVAIKPQHEVGLHIGHVSQDHVHVLSHLADLGLAHRDAGFRLVAERIPGLDAGEQRVEPIALQALHVRLREERQTALSDEAHAPGRHCLLDHIHIVTRTPKFGSCQPTRGRPRPADSSAHAVRQHRHRTVPAMQIADCISGLCRAGEGADEQHVCLVQQLGGQILGAGVADESHIVTKLLTPDGNRLWHDACRFRIHDAIEEPSRRPLGHQVKNGNPKFAQDSPLNPCPG